MRAVVPLPVLRLAGLLLAGSALGGILAPPAAAQTFQGLGYLAPTGTPNLGGPAASVATGISANGGLIVGYSNIPSPRNIPPGAIFDPIEQAFTWTAASGLVGQPFAAPLFVPALVDDFDARSRNMAASANGGVVVGWAKVPSVNFGPGTAVQATLITGGSLALLGYLVADTTPIPDGFGSTLPLTSLALGVSGDGSIAVGSSYNGNLRDIQAFYWTAGGGMVGLPYLTSLGTNFSQANGISADGKVIVGLSSGDDLTWAFQAVRWSGPGFATATPLGFLAPGGPAFSAALAVNADGSVVVGGSNNAGGVLQAFRWSAAGGMVGLAGLPGGVAAAAGSIWPGGGYPTGLRSDIPIDPSGPYTNNSFLASLSLPPVISLAYALTPDGSVIVGTAMDSAGTGQAVRWDSTGIATIQGLLTTAGVGTTGWVLNAATGIAVPSAGTQLITGYGTIGGLIQAWLARLTAPVAATPTAPPSGITTPGALFNSVGLMPSAPAMAERITWGNQRDMLLAALRYGTGLTQGQVTGFVSANGAGWDPVSRVGGQVTGSAGLIGRISPWLRVGLAVTHDWEQDQVSSPKSKGTIWGTGGHLFALAGDATAGPRAAATINYEDLGAKIRRGYVNGSGTAYGTGTAAGETLGTAIRAAWGFPIDPNTTVSPFGQVNWQRSHFSGYAERYANNPFPAVFNGQTYESVVLGAGVEAERRFGWGRAWASANYSSRVIGGSGAMVSGHFVDLFSFNVRGAPVPERNWVETTFGGSVRLADNLELVANLGIIVPTNAAPQNSWHVYGSAAVVMGF